MKYYWIFSISFAAVIVLGCFVSETIGDDDTLAIVLNDLRTVSDSVHCGRFTWSETITQFPGASRGESGEPIPSIKLVLNNEGNTFQFQDSRKFLHRYHLRQSNASKKNVKPSVRSFDGKEEVSLHPEWKGYEEAIIFNRTEFSELQVFDIWPMLFQFRAVPERGCNLQNAVLTVAESTDEDLKRLKRERDQVCKIDWVTRFGKRILFLDKKEGHRLIELRDYLGEGENATLDASILIRSTEQDAKTRLFVPTSWIITHFGNSGAPLIVEVCRMSSYSINDFASLESFTLTPFPNGTYVTNEKRGTRGFVGKGK